MADLFGDCEAFNADPSASQTTVNAHSRRATHDETHISGPAHRSDHGYNSSMNERSDNYSASWHPPRAAESQIRIHTNGPGSRVSSGESMATQGQSSNANASGMSQQKYASVTRGGSHGMGTSNVHSVIDALWSEQGSRNMPQPRIPFEHSPASSPSGENSSLSSLASQPDAMLLHSFQPSNMTWSSSAPRNNPDDVARILQAAHEDKAKTKQQADHGKSPSSVPGTSFGAKRIRPGSTPAAPKLMNPAHNAQEKHESIGGKHARENKVSDGVGGDSRNVRACSHPEASDGNTDSVHSHAIKAHRTARDQHTTRHASTRIEEVETRQSPPKTTFTSTPKQSAEPCSTSSKLASAGQKEVTSKTAHAAESQRPKEATSTHVTPEKACATTKRSLLLCLGDMSGAGPVYMLLQVYLCMQNHMLFVYNICACVGHWSSL
jgi:hypothetical protein